MWSSSLPHHRFWVIRYLLSSDLHSLLIVVSKTLVFEQFLLMSDLCYTLHSFPSSSASAFSERYLGSPKTDSRVYQVDFQHFTLSNGCVESKGLFQGVMSTRRKVRKTVSKSVLNDWFFSFSFFQMANLAHRGGQLLDKQYMIIHPTADGNIIPFTSLMNDLAEIHSEKTIELLHQHVSCNLKGHFTKYLFHFAYNLTDMPIL